MKDGECQDDGGSHHEVANGQIGNRCLRPERHAGEVEQQGRYTGQFKAAADGKEDIEKAHKHHCDSDEHHRDVQMTVIRAVVLGRRALVVLFVWSHGVRRSRVYALTRLLYAGSA